jgi:hypothetical protein
MKIFLFTNDRYRMGLYGAVAATHLITPKGKEEKGAEGRRTLPKFKCQATHMQPRQN